MSLWTPFRDDDTQQMTLIENTIVRALMPFRERIEARIVVLALSRCILAFLRHCSETERRDVLTVIVPFIQGGPPPPGVENDTPSGLVIN